MLNLSFQFALDVIVYREKLTEMKKFDMANQLFRSGRSIHANIRDTQNAESKDDVLRKMKLAAKEGDEPEGSLLPYEYSPFYPSAGNFIGNTDFFLKTIKQNYWLFETQLANQLINESANQRL